VLDLESFVRCSSLEVPGTVIRAADSWQNKKEEERDRRDEACNGVHGGDAGRCHRAQGAGGQAVHVRGEAGCVPARWPVRVSGWQRQQRRRACRRGVVEDGHVPQLLGAQLELPRLYATGAGELHRDSSTDDQELGTTA
jgi:hypothetical protein